MTALEIDVNHKLDHHYTTEAKKKHKTDIIYHSKNKSLSKTSLNELIYKIAKLKKRDSIITITINADSIIIEFL